MQDKSHSYHAVRIGGRQLVESAGMQERMLYRSKTMCLADLCFSTGPVGAGEEPYLQNGTQGWHAADERRWVPGE